MKRVNDMTVFEPTDKCSLDEYSGKMAIEVPELIKKAKEETNQKVTEISENDIKQDNEILELKTNYTKLQEQNTKLENQIKKDRENMINLEVEGQNIYIEDSSDLEGKLEVLGNVEQDVTETGINIFNGKLEIGAWDYNTGQKVENKAQMRSVDYINVEKLTKISIIKKGGGSFTCGVRYYAEDKKLIGRASLNNVTDAVTTTIVNNIDSAKKVKYATLTFTHSTDISEIFGVNKENDLKWQDFIPNSPSPEYPSEIRAVGDNINLFNKDTITLNSYIDKNTGNTVSNASNNASDYIELNNNFITLQGIAENDTYALYDKNKTYVKGGNLKNITPINVSNTKYIRFTIKKTVDLNKVKLEKGTVATNYSKFGQGSVEIVKANENMLTKPQNLESANLGITIKYDKGQFILNGTTTRITYIKLNNEMAINTFTDAEKWKTKRLKSGSYAFSLNRIKGTASTDNINLYLRDSVSSPIFQEGIVKINSLGIKKTKFKNETDCDYFCYLWIPAGTTLNNFTFSLMLEPDTEIKDFIENKEQTYILPIQKTMLEEDYFVREEEGRKELHNWEKHIFSGNENWTKASEGNMYYIAGDTVPKYNSKDLRILSNCAMGIVDETITSANTAYYKMKNNQVTLRNHETKAIYFRYDDIKTVQEFKEKIAGKYIYYILETQSKLPCTPEQTKILDELENLQTYKPTTNITTDSIAKLKLKYIADTKTYVDNKYNGLAQQILNLAGGNNNV